MGYILGVHRHFHSTPRRHGETHDSTLEILHAVSTATLTTLTRLASLHCPHAFTPLPSSLPG